MYDLKNSGLSLRTIKPKDLGQFATDLNHNFMTILNAVGFKGMPGQSIKGDTGIGTRGTKWFFVSTRITQFTSTYGLTGGGQVTVSFLNTAMGSNQVQLAETVGLPTGDSFVNGDMIVLISGQVAQLNISGTTPTWIDTGVTFEQAIGLTEDRVREIITSMIGSPSDADSVFRRFSAVAKNHTDASPGVNNALNSDSLLDIPTSDSGIGVPFANNYFVAPKEQTIGLNTHLCLLAGSPQKYHKLVQQTQEALTNQYVPGVDDFTAGIFLQSSYKNGIIMGHRDSATMKDFMRMYRTASSLILTSHYSPNLVDYSELQMSKSDILLRATNKVTINSSELIYQGGKLITNHFDYLNNVANIGAGNDSYSLNIYSKAGVYLRNIKNANFLSTNADGKIQALYTLVTTIATSATDTQIPTAKAVRTIYDEIKTTLDNHNTRITTLENADTSNIFKARDYYPQAQTVSLNSIHTEGNYIISGNDTNVSALPPTLNNDIPKDERLEYHVNVYRIKTQQVNSLKQVLSVRVDTASQRNHATYFRFANGSIGSNTFTWSSWQRLLTHIDVSPIDSLITRINELERKTAVFQVDGGMVLWRKPANLIPDGWREVVAWRGRLPMGYDPSQSEFNQLGEIGGSKTAILGANNLPRHDHDMRFRHSGAEQDNQISFLQAENWTDSSPQGESGGNGTGGARGHVTLKTRETGSSSPFSILNPYRVVMFIEYVGDSGGSTPVGGGGTPVADTTRPSRPNIISASPMSANSVWLSWTASTDNVSVAKYEIYRVDTKFLGSRTYTKVDETTAQFKVVGNLSRNTTYRFAIRAVDTSNNYSDYSAVSTVQTNP